ncbi:hypothetical protein C1H46_040675 [Malus baccata]|uniref:Brix domain-containing protein n=1 Tax=Malus baccata TaxID=106549 RepID=A0A540KHU7_MALBA|nr:hypothetical protein C1H46_040675 [Malus baccata]
MARFKNKKKVFVKSVSTKKQANMDHITGDKIPKSFVFSRCKLPGPLKQLQADLRKLMLPYTALKLKEKRWNNLRDFLNVAGPIGVTHFLMLLKTPTVPYLKSAASSSTNTAVSDVKLQLWEEDHGNGFNLISTFASDFTREGCPIKLPENVVPAAYREWEVKVFDWQTQCPTLANPDGHTLLYETIELLPAVGCEADAATR